MLRCKSGGCVIRSSVYHIVNAIFSAYVLENVPDPWKQLYSLVENGYAFNFLVHPVFGIGVFTVPERKHLA